jgi:CTP synthase
MEEDPNTADPLLVLTACPVDNRPPGTALQWGGLKIEVIPGTLAYQIYKHNAIEETFNCSYELNPDYQDKLTAAGLRISGISDSGKARIVELPERSFFVGMGYIPQLSSQPGKPHPVITAFLKAAL